MERYQFTFKSQKMTTCRAISDENLTDALSTILDTELDEWVGDIHRIDIKHLGKEESFG